MDSEKEARVGLLEGRINPVDDETPSDVEERGAIKSRKRLKSSLLFLHAIMLVLNLAGFAVIFFWTSSPVTSLHPISDLRLRVVPQEYTDFEISPFAGPPSPEVDNAWHDLLEKTPIRVSKEELERSNQTSVALPDGGGYLAWLDVYHELHCIKMLRQWNYRDHYHPGLRADDKSHWEIHADHCLDVLRSAAMCHADTTLTTFGWADQPQPMLNTKPIQHRCIDWHVLTESVEHRIVSYNEVSALRNPAIDE